MPSIGTMTTGAGVVTSLTQQFLPQYLQIGNADDAVILQDLNVSTRGGTFVELTDQDRIQVLAKLDMQLIAGGASIPNKIRLSNGEILERTQFSLENAGVTTPEIYGNSTGRSPDRTVREVVENNLLANQQETFEDFEFLYMLPANVTRCEIIFANGYQDTFTVPELEGLFAEYFDTEANLLIDGHLVIAGYANPISPIASCKVYNGAGGATVVVSTGNRGV